MDEPNDSNGERGAGGPPWPSIYDRLMPLMYALIGAAATMFLNVLICGRPPRCPPARACAESGVRAKTPRTAPVRAFPAAPRSVPPPDAGASSRPPDAGAPPPVPDAREVPADSTALGAVEQRLATAVHPCVRPGARSFLVAVRLQPDGKVRRVFVARDPGVYAAMTACITKRLGDLTLPLKLSYAEWRVRRTDSELSLQLVRSQP